MSESLLKHPKNGRGFAGHRSFKARGWWAGLGFSLVIHGCLFWSLTTLSSRIVKNPVAVNVKLESLKHGAAIPAVEPAKKSQVGPPSQTRQPIQRPSRAKSVNAAEKKVEVKAGLSAESKKSRESPVAAPRGNFSESVVDINNQNTAVGDSSPVNLGDDNMPMSEAAADTDAKCHSVAELAITDEAAKAGITSGTLTIDIVVSKSGKVIDATLARGMGYGLDELALQAARDLSCMPALRDGSAVAVKKRFVWKVEF